MRSSSRASSSIGVGVVVDPEVDGDVVEAAVPGALLDHQDRRGLPATLVAARGVAGGERGEQPVGQRRVGSLASHASSIASTTSAPARQLPWIA